MHWIHCAVLVTLLSAAITAQAPVPADVSPPPPAGKRFMSYADARLVLEALPDGIPARLARGSAAGIESAWTEWVARHDAEIRSRLARGEEDSLVNLWLFGTSFTRLPPARDIGPRVGQGGLAELVQGRLDAFLDAMATPGDNERLQFARGFLAGQGLDPSTGPGRDEVRERLVAARDRAVAEFSAYDRTLENARGRNDPNAQVAAYATIFRNRGLSSDTSVLVDYAVEQTLGALVRDGVVTAGGVRRAAVVGPGLDFLNKADGYDVYPQQTIQPFALVDSLLRLGLSRGPDLRVTTFDLSPRVNHHLEEAVRVAEAGGHYTLRLPLGETEQWVPELRRYWERMGDQIGEDVTEAGSASAPGVTLRTVRIRPPILRSIDPRDVNIIVERVVPAAPVELFDLVVATNIFVYYDAFEQALAMANLASMLRPGGVLITNTLVLPTPPMRTSAAHAIITYSDRQYDHMFWYRRE